MNQKEKTADIILAVMGGAAVVWLGLLTAPYIKHGFVGIVKNLGGIMEKPFMITWCEDSLKTILVFLVVYLLSIGIYFSNRKNFRRKEEHGSAKWGSASQINKKYSQKPPENNRILTQHVRMGLDDFKHKRNLNVMVVGGSGAGKTRYYAKPNLIQGNDCSYIVLDPKGELLRSTGRLLEAKGYSVRVLNLIQMDQSHCYNPLQYIKSDNDAQKLVTNFFRSTMPKGQKSSDPFWDISAQMLLMSLIFLLLYEAPEEEQNFAMVMDLLRAGAIEDEERPIPTALDRIFTELEEKDSDHIALKYYNNYHSGAAKTLKSVQITLAARLEKFNLESLAKLTMTDELDLDSLGERKVALFAIIPDNDTSFNFLVSILYTQLFQQLFYKADHDHGGKLPIPVHFLMDEFANIALPDDFDKDLATMRSRGVSVSIILQNMAQLKALFEKQWESIAGNCDSFLYLGGNEQGTHKYVSELLGKETIDIDAYSRSRGQSPSYTTQSNYGGRDLLDPSEVRQLDNRNAILFIRGERPVIDAKYDLMHHPNIALTADGGAPAYSEDIQYQSDAAIEIGFDDMPAIQAIEVDGKEIGNYEFISEEELEREFKEENEKGSESNE